MKLLKRSGDRLSFSLAPREKELLERLLSFYPMQPEPATTISRDGGDQVGDAASVLDEALREQRTELSEWVRRRIADGELLSRSGPDWRLSLESSEIEQLLRVLNELRVGAWTKLGCPEDLNPATAAESPSRAPLLMIMTLAGQFEMVLLYALNCGSSDETTMTV